MVFTVYPPALRRSAIQLGWAAQAAGIARTYMANRAGIGWHDGGLINTFAGAHRDLAAARARFELRGQGQ